MFGFSLAKLAVLALIILGVWYGFKYVGKLQADRAAQRVRDERRGAGKPEAMVECTVCGVFMAPGDASHCGRKDCPY